MATHSCSIIMYPQSGNSVYYGISVKAVALLHLTGLILGVCSTPHSVGDTERLACDWIHDEIVSLNKKKVLHDCEGEKMNEPENRSFVSFPSAIS